MKNRDEIESARREINRLLRDHRECGLADDAHIELLGGDMLRIWRERGQVLFSRNARFVGIAENMKVQGLVNICNFGCQNVCLLKSGG